MQCCIILKILCNSFCSYVTGEVSHLERGQLHERIKPDFNLINVDDRVVPLELVPLGSPNDPDLVQCSSSALQTDHQQPNPQETPTSLSKQGAYSVHVT